MFLVLYAFFLWYGLILMEYSCSRKQIMSQLHIDGESQISWFDVFSATQLMWACYRLTNMSNDSHVLCNSTVSNEIVISPHLRIPFIKGIALQKSNLVPISGENLKNTWAPRTLQNNIASTKRLYRLDDAQSPGFFLPCITGIFIYWPCIFAFMLNSH